MRMWACPVGYMCKKHLLEEHAYLHILWGHIVKGHALDGFKGLWNIDELPKRHTQIEQELHSRGIACRSPVRTDGVVLPEGILRDVIEVEEGIEYFAGVCTDCAARIPKKRLVR